MNRENIYKKKPTEPESFSNSVTDTEEAPYAESMSLLERLKENIVVAQRKIDGGFLSRYEARDPKTGEVYCSESWNSSGGEVKQVESFPLDKKISEDEAWYDERGFIKQEYK